MKVKGRGHICVYARVCVCVCGFLFGLFLGYQIFLSSNLSFIKDQNLTW